MGKSEVLEYSFIAVGQDRELFGPLIIVDQISDYTVTPSVAQTVLRTRLRKEGIASNVDLERVQAWDGYDGGRFERGGNTLTATAGYGTCTQQPVVSSTVPNNVLWFPFSRLTQTVGPWLIVTLLRRHSVDA